MSATNNDSVKPKSKCPKCKTETIGKPLPVSFPLSDLFCKTCGAVAPSPLSLITSVFIASRRLIHRTIDCHFKCEKDGCGYEWDEEIEL